MNLEVFAPGEISKFLNTRCVGWSYNVTETIE